MCVGVALGEVHLGSPPQDEPPRGEDVRDDTEQHQEDGHGHHYHVVTYAARTEAWRRKEGRENRLLISESLRLRNCVVPSARTLCQYPTSCRSPAPGRRSAEERKAGLKFTFRQTGNANLKLTFDPTKLEISHQSHQVRDDQDDQEQAGGGGEG